MAMLRGERWATELSLATKFRCGLLEDGFGNARGVSPRAMAGFIKVQVRGHGGWSTDAWDARGERLMRALPAKPAVE